MNIDLHELETALADASFWLTSICHCSDSETNQMSLARVNRLLKQVQYEISLELPLPENKAVDACTQSLAFAEEPNTVEGTLKSLEILISGPPPFASEIPMPIKRDREWTSWTMADESMFGDMAWRAANFKLTDEEKLQFKEVVAARNRLIDHWDPAG